MLEQVESGVLQEMFTSIIEDADANILLLNEDFKVVSLNQGFYWIFIETYGIPNDRLSAEGFADYHPIVPNDSVENRARNRRVEIIFLNADPKGRPQEATP